MAYLTEYFSKQDVVVDDKSLYAKVVVDQEIDLPVITKSTRAVSTDTPEHGNFQTARDLNDEKTSLINALCNFPVVALWLLNEYDKHAISDDSEEELVLASDQAAVLNRVKRSYLLANQELMNNAANDPSYLAAKHNLSIALRQFAFSFEDLTRLVEVVVYAFKYRGLTIQSNQLSSPKQRDIVLKRLEGLHRRNRMAGVKIAEFFKSIDIDSFDEQFLFLSGAEMHSQFIDIVLFENRWLSLRQELATANSRLVMFIANQYKAGFLDFEDLVQEGQAGLLKAVDRFDYRLGFQFSTYAGYWIRQAISRALSRCERVVRIPCGQVANINKVYRLKEQFIGEKGWEPTVQELAEFAKMSCDDVDALMAISQTSLSLEASDDDGESAFAPIDFLEQKVFTHAFTEMAKIDLLKLLDESVESLNPREALVIRGHFGMGGENEKTLQEIGLELNLTRERVRQIQVIALNKIKENFGDELVAFL